MDSHPTPFPIPGKSQSLRAKASQRSFEATKTSSTEQLVINRHKRVFGTARNPNVQAKYLNDKPVVKKPMSGYLKKPAQSSPSSAVDTDTEKTKKFPDQKNRARPRKKKSACFPQKVGTDQNKDEAGGSVMPKTPTRSPSLAANYKPSRLSGTPYHSAEKCSKCRFDKLETSAYWVGQIKLAESVGKHFVSAAFFRLAFECKAEPSRNIRVELKKYQGRHEYLSAEKEWRDVCISYGLLKEEKSGRTSTDQAEDGKLVMAEDADCGPGQEQEDSKKPVAEESGIGEV